MKLRILFLLLAVHLFYQPINSQTHTWTGDGNGMYWSDPLNWSSGEVPLSNGIGDIVIPTGDVVINIGTINFERGSFSGGGEFVNKGLFNMFHNSNSDATKSFSNILFNNMSALNIYQNDGVDNDQPIYINQNAIFRSYVGLTLDNVNISFQNSEPGTFIVSGEFTKIGAGTVTIDVKSQLLWGSFAIEEGTLIIKSNFSNLFQSPDLMISENSSLIISGDTTFESGASLDGVVNGYFEITSDGNRHPHFPSSYFFALTGITHLVDVTLTGVGTIHVRSPMIIPESSTLIIDQARLSNQNLLITEPFSQIIVQNEGRLSNGGLGEFVLNQCTISGTDLELFGNSSTIFVTDNSINSINNINLFNLGTIDLQEGSLLMSDDSRFENYTSGNLYDNGIVAGKGYFKFPFFNPNLSQNDGYFSPGPGIATLYTTNFSQTILGLCKIEINNLSEFDKIDNTESSNFYGGFEVDLNFAPHIGDSFEIFRSDEPLSNCDPIDTVVATFEGYKYTFSVICNLDNITLELEEITLNISDSFYDNTITIIPNPIIGLSTFRIPSEFISNTSIEIYNFQGQEVTTLQALSENTVFDRGNLPSGIYFARLVSENNTLGTTTLIVE